MDPAGVADHPPAGEHGNGVDDADGVHEAGHIVFARKSRAMAVAFPQSARRRPDAVEAEERAADAGDAAVERDLLAAALGELGTDRALVVSSEDGLDEMSTSAPTHVVEVNGNAIERYVVTPQDVGIGTTTPDAVTGGTPDAGGFRFVGVATATGPSARPMAMSAAAPEASATTSCAACRWWTAR